jgi:hypothetical protein
MRYRRLVLNPLVVNIQTSWVKLGIGGVEMCLAAGANDLGGTLMNESISRAAGTQHGQELPLPLCGTSHARPDGKWRSAIRSIDQSSRSARRLE